MSKPFIIAVIPAHNEEAGIVKAIEAVAPQVDYVIVMSDNSTDETATVASRELWLRQKGRAYETAGNTARKAGALNQALDVVNAYYPVTHVLIMDADTILSEGWVDRALKALDDHKADAAGAIFGADREDTWLTHCQSLEWARYAEEGSRTGKTHVLSGTAALIKWSAMAALYEQKGYYYDEKAITEDFQLTADLKQAGAVLCSPSTLTVTTETMPTVMDLFRQRRRWSLGALQVCKRSKANRVMFPYYRQQALLIAGIVALWAYIGLSIYGLATYGFQFHWFWSLVGLIFVVERVVTVWDKGWWSRLVAALILPELIYALVLQVAHLAAIVQFVTGSQGSWHHVETK